MKDLEKILEKAEQSLRTAVVKENYLLDGKLDEELTPGLKKLFVWVAQRYLKQKGYVPYYWIEYLQSELGGNDESTSN